MFKFREFIKENNDDKFKPISSFYLNDNLNPDVWEDFTINENIKEELLKIATDYFNSIELDVDIDNIILTGSNCNFNWSEYSDFDLHILVDFKEINNDVELVSKYLKSLGSNWNNEHSIKIAGYDVEIYIQDTTEPHVSTGQYSILNDEWVVKPTKENFIPDENLIKDKSSTIMDVIDRLESDLNEGMEYDKLMVGVKKVWNKIKDARKSGLQREGEYSIENLVFKLLRRNGYIEKIINIRVKAYDNQFE